MRTTRNHLVVFLIGLALSIAQFVMIRDFVTILYGEEVVIVLVTAAFFLGLSLGYALSLELSPRVFTGLFVGSVFLHLTFPFSYRYLATWLAAADAPGVLFLVLLFVYALIFTSLYAVFLPRLVTLDANGDALGRLRQYYALELLGFLCGFACVAAAWNRPLVYLLTPYWLLLGVLLALVVRRPPLTIGYAAVAAFAAVYAHRLDYASTSALYAHKHGVRDARTLYSVNSPYQKVEVVESAGGTRHLYLDGLEDLNSTDLDALNYYIAELPARLARPARVLIVGNGTLSSVKRVYPHAGEVVSVELDGGVLEAGRRYFTPPESLAGLDRWSLRVDDGKRYLRASKERFDLVVMDVPSPLTIQEAYLHSREFYELVREHLSATGVVAVQLSGPLQRNDRTPARVTAALRLVFDDVLALYSARADRGFAYGSMELPFGEAELRAEAAGYEAELEVVPPDLVDSYLTAAVPFSVDRMDIVLRRGLERFLDRYLH